MNGSTEADTEVELSAEDLLALSASPAPATNISSAPTLAPQAPARRHPSISRLALGLIITTGLGGAAYALMTSSFAKQSIANVPAATVQMAASTPATKAESTPVRYANPFDKQEVFEFPPGTSETEAREAVAQLLMERAMSRQET